jgi:structural maintenance of chromosome 1
MEEETAKARREVQLLAKELANVSHQIGSTENKIESKKSEKHNLLMQAKMEAIAIPKIQGSLDDVAQQSESESQEGSVSNRNFREQLIQMDYSSLTHALKKPLEPEQVKKK